MKARIPSYRLHKATGQAVVTIGGKDRYLGPYGTAESRQKYGDLLSQHAANLAGSRPARVSIPPTLTINELALAFLRHAQAYYVKNGKPTSEVDCYKLAIRPLVSLYGDLPATDFGPNALRVVRQRMIDVGNLCRKSINDAIGRIRSLIRWGVSHEMLPATVLNALEAVEPLKRGRSEARETAARHPVPDDDLEQVRAIVPERTRDLIDLQLLSGARSGELMMLTSGMIDRSADIWIAKLASHKTEHHDIERVLLFGPRAQLILRKYLTADPGRKLFALRRDTYGKAIKDACVKLGIPSWTPHWLRHNAASHIRDEFGLDAAQVMLGHSSADMTQLYAHLNLKRAIEVARKRG